MAAPNPDHIATTIGYAVIGLIIAAAPILLLAALGSLAGWMLGQ